MSIGILRQTGGGRFDWHPFTGDAVERIDNAANAPINQIVLADFQGNRLIEWSEAEGYGQGDIDVGLIHAVSEESDATDSLRETVANHARAFERAYSYAYHRRVRCVPYVVVDPIQPRGLTYNPAAVKDQIDQFDQHTHWIIRGGYKSGTDGEAYMGTTKAIWYSGPVSVAMHEMGHCLGLGHARRGINEYGGELSWMASRKTAGLNAQNAHIQGTLGPHKHIQGQGGAWLVPSDTHASDVQPGEYAAVLAQNDGYGYVWLTTRLTRDQSPIGVHRPLGTVYAVAPVGDLDATTTDFLGSLQPGETRQFRGITVTNHGGGLLTRVSINGGETEDPAPREIVPAEPITEAHSAVWRDPRFKYQGVDLHIRGDQAVGYWFTHGIDGGRTWRVLDGRLDDGVWHFDIIDTSGRQSRVEGSGRMWLKGPDRGRFEYRCESWGIGHLLVRRLTPAREGGIHKTGELEGFSVSRIGSRLYAYRYHYNGDRPDWTVYAGTENNLGVYRPVSRFRWYHGEAKRIRTAKVGESRIDGHELERVL